MNIKPSSIDLISSVNYYLDNLSAKGYSQQTINLKSYHLNQFIHWLDIESIKDLEDIDLNLLDSYLAYLRGYRKKQNGLQLASTTIRTRATTVKVFLRAMHVKGVIYNTEFDKFELPRAGKSLPKPILSYLDILSVIKQIPNFTTKGIRDRAIVECFYASGIRRSELINLDLIDLDISSKQIRIEKGKGGKDRYVPIGKMAISWIKKYLHDSRPLLVHIGSGKSLFLANDGKRFRPCSLSSLMSKYISKANINKFGSCHQYRHAAATHMVDNDADIRHVQEFLGHSSISTTQVYVHVSKAKLQRVYKKSHPRAE